jgi:hypothetical protein
MLATLMAVLGLLALYFGLRVARGYRLYRGSRLLRCPETQRLALVEMPAGVMALEASLGDPRLRVRNCSRWPMCRECGENCLRQIESPAPGMRLSAAWRTL